MGERDWFPHMTSVAPTPWGTGALAPNFTNGWHGGTVSRKTAKKLTKLC